MSDGEGEKHMKKFVLFGVTGAMLLSALGTAFAAGPRVDREAVVRHHRTSRPAVIIAVTVPIAHARVAVTHRYDRMVGARRCAHGHRHHDEGNYGHREYRR